MVKAKGFILAVALAATASTFFGCSSDDGSKEEDSNVVKYTFTDTRDGKVYKYVTIGNQVWMAENLNYNANGSKCYDNLTANCAKYGRLYDWATAMDISSEYNDSAWGGELPHQGICPDGWHIPSYEEWDTLVDYVGRETAGTKLKSTSGWKKSFLASVPSGTDNYGFSALPGGGNTGEINFPFTTVGYYSNWWGATGFFHGMDSHSEDVSNYLSDDGYKSWYFSVRCLKTIINQSSSSVAASSSSIANSSSSKDTFTDARDGQTYEYVTIGNQVWMAENLNYDASGSRCYDNDPGNCDIYGRLYDWATAMNLDSIYNDSAWDGALPHQGICPAGWHIASDDEWAILEKYVGNGTKLKTKNGWDDYTNGTDDYGFSALPGGYIILHLQDSFGANGSYWWSATENNSAQNIYGDRCFAYQWSLNGGSNIYSSGTSNVKANLFSIRCIKD